MASYNVEDNFLHCLFMHSQNDDYFNECNCKAVRNCFISYLFIYFFIICYSIIAVLKMYPDWNKTQIEFK